MILRAWQLCLASQPPSAVLLIVSTGLAMHQGVSTVNGSGRSRTVLVRKGDGRGIVLLRASLHARV